MGRSVLFSVNMLNTCDPPSRSTALRRARARADNAISTRRRTKPTTNESIRGREEPGTGCARLINPPSRRIAQRQKQPEAACTQPRQAAEPRAPPRLGSQAERDEKPELLASSERNRQGGGDVTRRWNRKRGKEAGELVGLQGVGVLDVSFEHLDGVPVRLPHPPPPPPPPFSSKCRTPVPANPTPPRRAEGNLSRTCLVASNWEEGRRCEARGGLGGLGRRAVGWGGVGWVAWGGEWWAEGDDEGARAAQGQGAGSAQGRQGRAERAACARGGRGRVGAREVMRSPWVWGRGAPLRLPGPPCFAR
jgi:hypothetical protein